MLSTLPYLHGWSLSVFVKRLNKGDKQGRSSFLKKAAPAPREKTLILRPWPGYIQAMAGE
jgi:hypothetical protein